MSSIDRVSPGGGYDLSGLDGSSGLDGAEAGGAAAPAGAAAEAPAATASRGRGPAAQAAGSPPPAEAAALRAAALEAGRKTKKSDGPEGPERVLAKHQEKRIERLFATLDPALAARLDRELAAIEGCDAPLARALFLKAAAARSEDLLAIDDPARREAALATLAAFAGRLDGMPAEELLRRSTVLDLDSRVSTSDVNPDGLSFNAKKPGRGLAGDTRTDNDGLFQRFTASCGSTTLQMALYEEDPVRAFAAHDAGVSSADPDSLVGRFQAELLERYDGVAISRLSIDAFARFKKTVGELRESEGAKSADLDALRDYVTHAGPLGPKAERALDAMREATGGFPTPADLETIRGGRFPRKDEGLGFEELGKALNDHLAPITGTRYRQTNPPDGFAKGQAWRHLDAVEEALARGVDVPFGITVPPHWMLLTAVKGREPDRKFLVSDPGGGVTAWVSEQSLVKGDFIAGAFRMGRKAKKGHVDSFYLPEDA